MTNLSFKTLTIDHLEEIEILQQIVIHHLDDPTILQPLSREEFENILGENGMMLGAFEQEKLIACRALLKPDANEDEHLGIDVGAPNLERVLYQEVSFVHPAYRGYGLQRKLGEQIMASIDPSEFDFVCATVKPFNIASLKDKFRQGMYIVALKYKYGGKLRYVFAKQLLKSAKPVGDVVLVDMADTFKQQELLANSYIGCELIQTGNGWAIIYKKK